LPAVVTSSTTESDTPAPAPVLAAPVAAASSAQVAEASPPAVLAAPVSSTPARSDPALVRATATPGNLAAAAFLHGSNDGSGGSAEVAVVASQAGDGASPAIALGEHGDTSVSSLATRAGAPASGSRDLGTAPVFAVEREAPLPRLPGVLGDTSDAAAGRRAALEGLPSSRAAWAETLGLRGADVLTACARYDRGAIERAIDAFLGELGRSSGSSLSALRPWSEAIPGVIVAGVALGILEMERRRSRDRRDVPRLRSQNDPEAPLPGFPGRRLAWSLED
jgi:hypothetical protein